MACPSFCVCISAYPDDAPKAGFIFYFIYYQQHGAKKAILLFGLEKNAYLCVTHSKRI